MERAKTLATRGLIVAVGLVLAILLGAWIVTDVVKPFTEGGRVVHREAGFAVTFPRDWESIDAAVVTAGRREHDWYVEDHGDPGQQHADFVAYGGVLMARTTALMSSHQWCDVVDLSGIAAMEPVWDTIGDAVTTMVLGDVDSEPDEREVVYQDHPAGRVAVYQRRLPDGTAFASYFYTDGTAWFELICGSRIPPEDRWLSVAETFEFLTTQ